MAGAWLRTTITAAAAAIALAAGPALAAGTTATAGPGPGPFTKHTHPGVGATGPRDYWIYQPTTPAERPRPLVVYLHGCLQDATVASIGTRWNELAERRGFVVVYPEQAVAANGTQCWNWFLPEHQGRDAGEPAVIASITRDLIAGAGGDIDANRVYIAGISAGADMATIMAAAYPDLYAAQAALAGCPYLTCADVTGAQAFAAMGTRARVVPTMVVQGTADGLNNFAMGEALARQWVGTNDRADNGAADGSIAVAPSAVEHHGFDPTLLAGAGTVGDLCVRNRQWPCPGAVAGLSEYPHSIERHADGSGCSVVDFWIIHGLSHNYPGGDPAGNYTDPIGPDVTTAAYDFFLRHALGAAPCAAPAVTATAGGTGAEPPPPSADDRRAPSPLPAAAGADARAHPATGAGRSSTTAGLVLLGAAVAVLALRRR